ncbi:MAG: S8 family serine peptidase [Gemmatimonadota bacterium]
MLGAANAPPPSLGQAVSSDLTPSAQEPFYYYFKQKIPLAAEAGELVVQLPRGSSTASVAGLAAQAGLTLRSATRLQQAADLWLVEVAPGLTSPDAESSATRLRSLPGVQFAEPSYRLVANGERIRLLNRLVVRFAEGVTPTQVDSFTKAFSLRLERPPRPDSAFYEYLFQFPAGLEKGALQHATAAAESPLVAWADIDKLADARRTYVPSDPFYSLQFHLRNTQYYNGVRVDANVEQAWDLTIGSGMRVAIIDDGVDILHGNSGGGFAGDLIGPFAGAQAYDAINSSITRCVGDPFFPAGNDTHGTSIAGLIAATHNNGEGVTGIAPGVVFTVVRIFCNGDVTFATENQVSNAINYAWQGGSHVLNNSWRWGPPSTQIQSAIDQATSLGRAGKGSVVVFAAGNAYPAAVAFPNYLPNVITVGAITRSGPRASYSQNWPVS